MKYPLRVAKIVERPWSVAVADADGKIVCHVMDVDRAQDFARFVVRAANRWGWVRGLFNKYTREDWLWEKNTCQN